MSSLQAVYSMAGPVHLKVGKEAQLLWQQHEKSAAASAAAACGTAHAVNVFLGVVWRVILYDPVHCRNIQPARCHVCTQQDALFGLAELQEG